MDIIIELPDPHLNVYKLTNMDFQFYKVEKQLHDFPNVALYKLSPFLVFVYSLLAQIATVSKKNNNKVLITTIEHTVLPRTPCSYITPRICSCARCIKHDTCMGHTGSVSKAQSPKSRSAQSSHGQ